MRACPAKYVDSTRLGTRRRRRYNILILPALLSIYTQKAPLSGTRRVSYAAWVLGRGTFSRLDVVSTMSCIQNRRLEKIINQHRAYNSRAYPLFAHLQLHAHISALAPERARFRLHSSLFTVPTHAVQHNTISRVPSLYISYRRHK